MSILRNAFDQSKESEFELRHTKKITAKQANQPGWSDILVFSKSKNILERAVAVILNAAITQKRKVFKLSRDSMNDLLSTKLQSRRSSTGIKNEQYTKLRRQIRNLPIFHIHDDIIDQRGYHILIIEIIDRTFLELIPNVLAEVQLAQIKEHYARKLVTNRVIEKPIYDKRGQDLVFIQSNNNTHDIQLEQSDASPSKYNVPEVLLRHSHTLDGREKDVERFIEAITPELNACIDLHSAAEFTALILPIIRKKKFSVESQNYSERKILCAFKKTGAFNVDEERAKKDPKMPTINYEFDTELLAELGIEPDHANLN